MAETSKILITKSAADYLLLDSGDGEKLEKFGKFSLSRPDPQALWHKQSPESEWKKADGHFKRGASDSADIAGKVSAEKAPGSKSDWNLKKGMPERWSVEFGGLKFWIKPSSFKHTGLFPEQSVNWDWLRGLIRGKKDVEVLNLFGYTGGATLACSQAGAKVVHVDGSKVAITWARDNAELSGLKDKPVRWILDDAHTFVKREVKRGRKYDGIIMDPPAFGHGPNNELWKIEESFLPLVDDCMKILKDKPLFFLINGYSAGYSAMTYENVLLPLRKKFGGNMEIGELAIEESNKAGQPGRLLPCGIFARWSI